MSFAETQLSNLPKTAKATHIAYNVITPFYTYVRVLNTSL